MFFLGGIVGRILLGTLIVGGLGATVAWWQINPDGFAQAMGSIGRMLLFAAIVAVLPVATLFLITAAVRRDSNRAGALLVIGYTLVDAVILLALFDFAPAGSFGWIAVGFGTLLAGAYNLLVCDLIADRIVG